MALRKKERSVNWSWSFKYTDENGKEKEKCFTTGVPASLNSDKALSKARKIGLQKQKEFLAELEKKKSHKISKREKENEHANDTLREYAAYWLQEIQGSVQPNTLISYKAPLEKHILPLLGDIRLSELDQFDLKEFINTELADCERREKAIAERMKKAKGKTVKVRTEDRAYTQSIKKHIAIIKMMLEFAVSEGDVQDNVAKKISKQVLKKIPESTFEAEPYSKEEIEVLRNGIAGHHLEAVIILASYLGLRREEVLGLRWEDVDFKNSCVYIRQVCVLVGTKIEYRMKTKTTDSKARLYMIEPLKKYLQALKERQKADQEFFGEGYIENDLVCKWNNGKPIKPGNVSDAYGRLLEKIGLRHTRFHDLRVTVGGIILDETGDIKLAQQILRHSTIQTTAAVYSKHSKKVIVEGLETLDTDKQE